MTPRPAGPRPDDVDRVIASIEQADAGLPDWLIPARDLSLHVRQPEWLYREMIMSDSVGVVYGPSGVGKSFFMLDVVTDLACAGSVAYIAYEGQWGYERRRQALAQAHPARDLNSLYFVFRRVSLFDDDGMARLTDGLASIQPRLVIFDTLAQATVGANENGAGEMGLAVQAMHRLREELQGATVIAVHHTGKDGVTDRGSSALIAGSDFAIQLLDEDGVTAVSPAKVKDGQDWAQYFFTLEPSAQSAVIKRVDGKYVPPHVTRTQTRVLHALTLSYFRPGARAQELSDFTGINRRGIQSALSHLLDKTYVERTSKGDFAITTIGETALRVALMPASTGTTP